MKGLIGGECRALGFDEILRLLVTFTKWFLELRVLVKQ